FLQFQNHPLARLFLFFLEYHAPIDNGVLFRDIELNNPAGDLLSDEFFQLGGVLGSAARSGQERAHTDIHTQAALYGAGYHAAHSALFLESFFERTPILRTSDLDLGKRVVPFRVAARDADSERLTALRRLAAEGARFDHALGLEADIDEDEFQ